MTGVRHGRRRRVLSRKWYNSSVVRAWCGACARRAAAAGGAVPSSAATTRSAQITVYCTIPTYAQYNNKKYFAHIKI